MPFWGWKIIKRNLPVNYLSIYLSEQKTQRNNDPNLSFCFPKIRNYDVSNYHTGTTIKVIWIPMKTNLIFPWASGLFLGSAHHNQSSQSTIIDETKT